MGQLLSLFVNILKSRLFIFEFPCTPSLMCCFYPCLEFSVEKSQNNLAVFFYDGNFAF